MSTATALAPKPQPPVGAAPRRRSASTWRLIDRVGLAFAWLLGLLFCAIAASIVIYLLIEGLRYVRPSLLVTHPTVGLHREPDRRLPRPDDRHGAGGARSRWRSRCRWGSATAVWLSEYGRPSALARVAESTVEMLAGDAVDRAGAVRHADLRGPGARLPQPDERRGRVRAFVLRGRGDAVARRAAARGGDRARGAPVDSRPRPRGFLRGRQDEDRDHAAGAAARRPPVRHHRLDARRRARDRRHRDHRRPAGLHAAPPRRRLGAAARPAARDGQHADQLHLLQRADRRRQPAGQGVRGRVRAADARARAQRRRGCLRRAARRRSDGAEHAAARAPADRPGARVPAGAAERRPRRRPRTATATSRADRHRPAPAS